MAMEEGNWLESVTVGYFVVLLSAVTKKVLSLNKTIFKHDYPVVSIPETAVYGYEILSCQMVEEKESWVGGYEGGRR
jgi:hypothetical protein